RGALATLRAINDGDEARKTRSQHVLELRHPCSALCEAGAKNDDVLGTTGFERADEPSGSGATGERGAGESREEYKQARHQIRSSRVRRPIVIHSATRMLPSARK